VSHAFLYEEAKRIGVFDPFFGARPRADPSCSSHRSYHTILADEILRFGDDEKTIWSASDLR
jgi:hypothetical protein